VGARTQVNVVSERTRKCLGGESEQASKRLFLIPLSTSVVVVVAGKQQQFLRMRDVDYRCCCGGGRRKGRGEGASMTVIPSCRF